MSQREASPVEGTGPQIGPVWSRAVPVRELAEVELPEGTVALLIPRFRKWPLNKWVQPRLKRPNIRLKLDEIGSCVWRLCDGETTVEGITTKVKERFSGRSENIEARLRSFLNTLYRSGFVTYVIRE